VVCTLLVTCLWAFRLAGLAPHRSLCGACPSGSAGGHGGGKSYPEALIDLMIRSALWALERMV